MRVEKSFDLLDSREEILGDGPVLDEQVGVATTALDHLIEEVLTGREKLAGQIFQLRRPRSPRSS